MLESGIRFWYVMSEPTEHPSFRLYYQILQEDFNLGWYGTETVKMYLFQNKEKDGTVYRRTCGTGPFDEWSGWELTEEV